MEWEQGIKDLLVESPEITTDCRVRFEKNDTKRSKVRKVYLKNILLSIDSSESLEVFPPNMILKEVYFTGNSIQEQKIRFSVAIDEFSEQNIKIQLIGSETDIKEFVKRDKFAVRLKFKNPPLKSNIKVKIQFDFLVEGELIKTILHQRILV